MLICGFFFFECDVAIGAGTNDKYRFFGPSAAGNHDQVIFENRRWRRNLRTAAKPPKAASAVINNLEIFLPLEGLIDFQVERARLEKDISRLEKQLEGLNTKLQSPDFLSKAPENIVVLEKKKKVDFESNLNKLKTNLESLAV